MTRRRLLIAALAVSSLAGACGSSGGSASAPAAASVSIAPSAAASVPSGSPAAQASVPASPVVGVVTKVDSAGLDKVSGFTLRTQDGQVLVVAIGVLENGAQFPPGHLAEHLATAAPVRVWFRDEGARLVAYRIEDAG
ncbi:MAG TPA: hypothetical protein VEY67_11940 [Candidatus Dormibacteraeota bacterium]|nr:hypothetical protein [Candidatus Dormibacteraeota bacterium]